MFERSIKQNRPIAIFSLIIFIIILDQVTKITAAMFLSENNFNSISIFPGFNIVFVRNTGISFGLFSDNGVFQRWFLTVLAGTVGFILLICSLITNNVISRFAMAFIAAGAMGNALDRAYFGGVIDFLDFFVYGFHWPAFNIADISIFIGVLFLLYDSFDIKERYL